MRARPPKEASQPKKGGDLNTKTTLGAGDEHRVLAESIDDRAGQGTVKFQHHRRFLAGEHGEGAAVVFLPILRLVQRQSLAVMLGDGDALHAIDAVMPQLVGLGIVGDQIIVFVIPVQGKGADPIGGAVAAQVLLLLSVVFVI